MRVLTLVLLVAAAAATRPAPILSQSMASVRQARARALGDTVSITGIVNSPPRPAGHARYTIFMQDSGAGLAVFSHARLLPANLAPGDRVRVLGVLRLHDNEKQLRALRLVRVARGPAPQALPVRAADLMSERYAGMLVRVSGGLVVHRSNSRKGIFVELRDTSAGIEVSVRKRILSEPGFTDHLLNAKSAAVVGVARRDGDHYELEPQRGADFHFAPVPPYRTIAAVAGVLFIMLLAAHFARERRRMERFALEREQAERRVRQIVESVNAVIFEADPRTFRMLYVNHQGEQLLGYPVSAWLESENMWQTLIHPDDYDDVLATCGREVSAGRDHELEYRVVTAQGDVRWVRDIAHISRDAAGQPDLICGVLVDVTALKSSEAAVVRAKAELRSLFDRVPVGVYRTRPDGTILAANDFLATMLGYGSAEDLCRLNARELYPAQEARRDWQINAGSSREVFLSRAELRRADGSTAYARERVRVVRDENGAPLFYEGVLEDLSEMALAELALKESEEKLRQAQKLEAIGRLAGGIAHDFNNLLTAMQCNVEITLEDLPPDVAVRKDLEQVMGAARRAARLVRQLLAFSRQQVLQPKVLDLNDLLGDFGKILQRMIGEDIHLNTALEPGTWSVYADPIQIEQVIMNLAVNARDALPQGGHLTIAMRNTSVGSSERLPQGDYVLLSVEDTGTGIAPDVCARIFEPYFTTKEVGKGTGLGLSTVYGIVQQSDGHLFVHSRVGVGTRFDIYLPRCEQRPTPVPMDRSRPQEKPSCRAAILVVEDETAVSSVIRRTLSREGYEVLVADSGIAGYELARSCEFAIDLLLTDVVMPGMSGPALHQEIARHRFDIPVIFMSGYNQDEVARRVLLAGKAEFLPKPFEIAELKLLIEKTLANPARHRQLRAV
ncbi:MAG: PAS domain S-box protein [Gemmatimonadota bacterium]